MRIVALGDRDPSYLTHREIDAALELLPDEIDCSWVATDSSEARDLAGADGVWLLPGTPYRDDDVAYRAIRHCLDTGTPFLGTPYFSWLRHFNRRWGARRAGSSTL